MQSATAPVTAAPAPSAAPAAGSAAPAAASAAASATPGELDYIPPPDGIASGRYDAPPWSIVAATFVILASVILFFVVRHRRHKSRPENESVAPKSSRR